MKRNILLSLFDLTGNWSRPYRENGFEIIQVDLQAGIDILTWDYKQIPKERVYGILAACPCTDFSLSGARHFARKDADGTTAKSIELVQKTLEIVDYFEPAFWVVENPMSRIHKLNTGLGEVKFKFNPCDFAGYLQSEEEQAENRYNKTTWLWGKFNNPVLKRIEPFMKDSPFWKRTDPTGENHINGSTFGKKGLSRQDWANIRSATPMGFAWAFYEANH
ncbi:DNA cytosine methyltransferase [Cellulosilyticum lentocellum]|uniref:C-5 cytosine-specific DNA methylase n=1 Tax=Cellulosilyticum lentocellum (strain ATCC 49066 / DSM 5427 / NCIMB 11756 / RHM5) TaxID=642492 RepID=F2JPJ0_CELLD|nr:DNA cytosine methyltransferase [Cellulosilyticum lentocellum]ADZ82538.1 C-5 cytosine-specific DNA methylase [Cellulosilyticum lentocellum DSM 5427]